jgi:hypothetical protein
VEILRVALGAAKEQGQRSTTGWSGSRRNNKVGRPRSAPIRTECDHCGTPLPLGRRADTKYCPPRAGKPNLPKWANDPFASENYAGRGQYDYSCKDRFYNARKPDTRLSFSRLAGDSDFDIVEVVVADEAESRASGSSSGKRRGGIVALGVGTVQRTYEFEDSEGILPWQLRSSEYERVSTAFVPRESDRHTVARVIRRLATAPGRTMNITSRERAAIERALPELHARLVPVAEAQTKQWVPCS